MNIKYKITFYSDWHCGSGLAAGADLDSLVIKDADKLPYIPGKTMKGLVRDAAEELTKQEELSKLNPAFGSSESNNHIKGTMFFTNAELDATEKNAIIQNNLTEFMYRDITSTKIGWDGIAEDHSLRKYEVTVPCELIGYIYDVPKEMVELITDSLKYIKRIGVNRNRGWGRCDISVVSVISEKGGNK